MIILDYNIVGGKGIMKKVMVLLIPVIMIMMMTNIVFANTKTPIPWSNSTADTPFSQKKTKDGNDGWVYYGSDGIEKNRWVQNYKYDWYYCGEDGFLLKSKWLHDSSDGKYYYLGDDMIMLHDTTTPDGYTVGSDGAWIKDGQVVVESSATTEVKNN